MSSSTMFSSTIRVLCAMAAAAGVSACGAPASQFPPVCPTSGLLPDAADITQFRGAGTDITDMVVDGRITGLGGKCTLDDPKHLRTQLTVNLDLTRGPASTN